MAAIRRLVRDHGIEDIQSALVSHYLRTHELRMPEILREGLAPDLLRAVSEDVMYEVRQEYPDLSLQQLTTLFELLIPDQDRKLNGAFFTPAEVAHYIASRGLLGDHAQPTLVDPSCGCGAILLHAAQQAADKQGTSIIDAVHQHIYGVDLHQYNIDRASVLLALLALSRGEKIDSWHPNLKQANSLGTDWNSLFPEPIEAGGFSGVIGNPPYVRFQQLPLEVRKELRDWQTTREGNYNLFFAFFELGWQLVKPDGHLSYIVPNSFYHLRAAQPLRNWMAQSRFIDRISDFGHHKIFDASVYTCVVDADKRERNKIRYRNCEQSCELQSEKGWADHAYESLDADGWRLTGQAQRRLLRSSAITDSVSLGELVDIRGGLATLRDRLYLIDESGQKEVDGRVYRPEPEITVPCLRISDVKSESEMKQNRLRILFPYEIRDGKPRVMDEERLADVYPEAYRYLTAIRPQLAQRDRGKKKYENWYAYGRNQGMTPCGPCLFTPVYAARPRFLMDTQGEVRFLNGLALTIKPQVDSLLGGPCTLELLRRLLHDSQPLADYMSALAQHISGGYAHYRPTLLREFSIPRLDEKQIDEILQAPRSDLSEVVQAAYRNPGSA